jgi:hypothetical protein
VLAVESQHAFALGSAIALRRGRHIAADSGAAGHPGRAARSSLSSGEFAPSCFFPCKDGFVERMRLDPNLFL